MENTHVKLLEWLENSRGSSGCNVSNFMYNNFEKPQVVDMWGWEGNPPFAQKFLMDIRNIGHISYEDDDFRVVAHPPRNPVTNKTDTEEQWFQNPLLVRMLPAGFDYLNQYRLITSNLALNSASKRNSRTQRRFTRTTILVAAVGALSSLFTFICNNPQIRGAESRIDKLEKWQSKQDTMLRDLQNLLSSPRDSSHTNLPSSLNTVKTSFSENKKATLVKK